MVKKGTGDGLLKYGIRQTPRKDNGEARRVGLYPITGGAAEADQIYESIQKKCTLTRADIKSVVSALRDELVIQFGLGRSCNLGDLGIFSPKIAYEGEALTAEEVENAGVYVSGINFRPSKSLLKDLKGISCGYSKDSDCSARINEDQLRAKLNEWYTKNKGLTIDQFTTISKLTPCTARRRLKALEECGALKNISTFKGRILLAKDASNEYWN